MPPRKSPALQPAVTRPTRASKEKARKVIQTAIKVSKPPRKSHPPVPVTRRATAISPTQSPSSSSSNEQDSDSSEMSWQGVGASSGIRNRRRTRESLRKMIRKVVNEILAERVANKSVTPVVPSVGVRSRGLAGGGIETGSATPTGMFPTSPMPESYPRHILLRWPWVDVETVTLIQLGQFDIESLPKLHQTDDLRNAYIKKSVKGILQPLDGGPSEILIGTTRLQASFREPTSFFLAWQTYISIRTAFHPDRASGLASWTERLHFYLSLNYPWSGILEYIIAYYKLNQNAVAEAWFDPNTILISQCLTLYQQKPAATVHQSIGGKSGSGGSRFSGSSKSTSVAKPSNEMCVMFNRAAGCQWPQNHGGQKCPHRHTCNVCTSDQHNALSCPKLK